MTTSLALLWSLATSIPSPEAAWPELRLRRPEPTLAADRPAWSPSPDLPPATEALRLAAAPEANEDLDPANQPHVWYGWQIIVPDAVLWHTMFLGVDMGVYWAVGMVFTGTVVHLAHGNFGRALLSAALRAAGMYVGTRAGLSSADGFDGLAAGVLGFFIGTLGAQAIDAALLAHDPPFTPERARPGDAAPAVAWTPTLAVGPDGALLGVAATF